MLYQIKSDPGHNEFTSSEPVFIDSYEGQLPNGWTYRFSVTQSLNLDKSPIYENGVPPEIPVEMDWTDLTTDEILEQAIQEIL